MKNSVASFLFSRSLSFIQLLLCVTLLFSAHTIAGNVNSEGWKLLVDNKPFEASKVFKTNLASSDKKIVGEAYRGLTFTTKFLGQYDTTSAMLFKSYMADKDTLLFKAAWINVLSFGREWSGHKKKDGYKVLKQMVKQPGLYNGESISMLTNRYVNDGRLSQAQKLSDKMDIVRSFRMIGPFDNISGSGYRKVYPPEQEIDFEKKHTGKDGSEVAWFPFHNKRVDGWLFTESNYSSLNSILYYYSNIQSEKKQKVYIGFGASGSFKVFLNDNLVLADSVFRNTGTDMFIQEVPLFKGDNKLLIKLGHERKYSNFLVRFMDKQGKKLSSVTYINTAGSFTKDTTAYSDLTNSPITYQIEKRLLDRLEKEPRDLEAAILLMDFYNASELTDKGQKLARNFIQYYPRSSLWHGLYSESLLRSRKVTDMQTELRTAYNLCNYNYDAWKNEVDVLEASASSKEVLNFIDSSPDLFKNTANTLLIKFRHYVQMNNESGVLTTIEQLQQNCLDREIVVGLLVTLYIDRGDIKKAETILKQFIKYERTSVDTYTQLAGIYLKMGQRAKAVGTYMECLKYSPNSPGIYYYLAKLSLQHEEYTEAEKYVDKALSFMPTSSSLISLKGTVQNSLGKKDGAIKTFKKSIRYTYNDFDAWDQLLPLEGKPELTSLTKLPDPASLRADTKSWKEIDNENGAILAYIKDIFFYPSRCSRERYFLMIHLPTQNAIDIWKEYSISYNSYYQVLNITRALARNAGGKETPADVSRNMIVFKTLQPGDDILFEWTIENYYKQDMAKQVWGKHEFSLYFPVYNTELRLVTPANDTIGYTVQGKNITLSKKKADEFVVTTFSRKPYKNPTSETFLLIDPPQTDKVYYSTFKSWADISNWYSYVTENKLEQTIELKALADSLTGKLMSAEEKVRKIHEYLTSAIRYSFVSFRQSAWIPQPANEVLAAKIGDCKDMSSLGKSLFDYAGIESNLVLVNTSDQNSIYPSFIGPDFNHCILSYSISGKRNFIDITDNSIPAKSLPRMDQGALALVITKDNDSLIHLPVDSSSERIIVRTITSSIDEKGTLVRNVTSVKKGVFAGDMRRSYRYLSGDEQKKSLQNILVKSYPNVKVDTFELYDLYSLKDSLRYMYEYTAKNAVQFTGKAALLALDIPDIIVSTSYPNEEERSYPIDMTHTWFGIGHYLVQGSLTIPKKWRLIVIPDKTSLSGEWGNYTLSIKQNGNVITYTRKAVFNFNKPVSVEKNKELRDVLSNITRADNVQLMFYTQ
jgi:tetratricopeptide (TPR) repeat protein